MHLEVNKQLVLVLCSVATFFLTALVLISMSSTMELLLSVKIHALNIILC